MRVWRIIAVSAAYPLEVALSVHNLAVLVGRFVSVQVDWLTAHWAGVFPAGTVRLHGGLPPSERDSLPHPCGSVQFDVERAELHAVFL
jgi:hypothetical protein